KEPSMARVAAALLAALVLTAVGLTPAADPAPAAPAGNYKVLLPFVTADSAVWLVKFDSKDDKPVVTILDQGRVPPGSKVQDVRVGDEVHFTIQMPMDKDAPGDGALKFTFKPAKEKGGKLLGHAFLGDQVLAAVLEPTAIADLKPASLFKEALAKP